MEIVFRKRTLKTFQKTFENVSTDYAQNDCFSPKLELYYRSILFFFLRLCRNYFGHNMELDIFPTSWKVQGQHGLQPSQYTVLSRELKHFLSSKEEVITFT